MEIAQRGRQSVMQFGGLGWCERGGVHAGQCSGHDKGIEASGDVASFLPAADSLDHNGGNAEEPRLALPGNRLDLPRVREDPTPRTDGPPLRRCVHVRCNVPHAHHVYQLEDSNDRMHRQMVRSIMPRRASTLSDAVRSTLRRPLARTLHPDRLPVLQDHATTRATASGTGASANKWLTTTRRLNRPRHSRQDRRGPPRSMFYSPCRCVALIACWWFADRCGLLTTEAYKGSAFAVA